MSRLFAVLFVMLGLSPVWGETLQVPQGPVLLTVTGQIGTTNAAGSAQFDLPMLKNLGSVTFETTTIWTEGTQVFTGVPLHRLLEAVGGENQTLIATAINDYSIEIPASDLVDSGPMVAFLMNGQPMSLRDKGPLWIVYPYDQNTEYQSEITYSRSIWQLDRLEVVP